MAWRTTEELWDVRWRRLGVFLCMRELTLDLWKDELRKGAALLIYSDIDTPIVSDHGICAQLLVLNLSWQLGVCGWWVLEARCIVEGSVINAGAMMRT